MARLPISGADQGTWGNVLNDYLLVAHEATGQIKAGTINAAHLSTSNAASSGQALAAGTNGLQWQSSVTSVDGASNDVTLTGKYIKTPQSFTHDAWATKADGTLSGTTADSGQAWVVSGGLPLRVRNHRVTLAPSAVGAGYGQISLGAPVWQMGAEFVFETGSTSTGAVTLVVANDASINLSDLACHFTVNPAGWVLETRQGGGNLDILASGAFTTPLVANGQTVYRMSVTLLGATAFIALPDGQVAVASNSRIATFNQGHCIWEVITNASTDKMPAITRTWAATSPDVEVPFALDSGWIRAVDRVIAKVLDANQNNVTSQRGTPNEVTMGDLGGFAGLRLGGDILIYRAGANTVAINSAATIVNGIMAHTGTALSFFGAPVAARPSLTYSRAGESAASAQVRGALSSLGLVADNTTA